MALLSKKAGAWLCPVLREAVPAIWDAPPRAANMDRMPVPQPTSRTLAPRMREGLPSRAL